MFKNLKQKSEPLKTSNIEDDDSLVIAEISAIDCRKDDIIGTAMDLTSLYKTVESYLYVICKEDYNLFSWILG
jgi:hypothetical protein